MVGVLLRRHEDELCSVRIAGTLDSHDLASFCMHDLALIGQLEDLVSVRTVCTHGVMDNQATVFDCEEFTAAMSIDETAFLIPDVQPTPYLSSGLV